jgi:hypothetical protein
MEAGEEGCAWNRALFEAGAEHRTWIPTTSLFHESVHTLYPEYSRKILPVLHVHLILCNASLILININIL